MTEVIHSLSTFPLFYEYIDDEDLARAVDFEERRRREDRNVIRWFQREIVFLIATRKIKPEDLKCHN